MNKHPFFPISNALGNAVEDLFNRSISDFIGFDYTTSNPLVNFSEHETNYILEMAAPGLQKEDFKISLENNMLSISVEKETTVEQKGKYTRKEFSYTKFKRSFTLPENVKADEISAKYENGILHLHLPKNEVNIVKNKTIAIE